ncbi:hypothetical protein ACLKA7_017169 [Drosophila subpalustris]
MNGNGCDWLPLLLLLAAVAVALQSELRHATCDNEERFENQMMCAGKEFGCLVPYPDNCSLFLVCDCVYPTVKLCPGELWWDNETQVCNYAQVTKCIYYTFTTPDPTTTAKTSRPEGNTTMTTLSWSTTEENWPTSSYDPPPPPPGINETFCKNFKDGSVHRYPYDCNAYINCTLGWPVLNYCAPDKVFNQHLLICDTPETAQCEPLPLPSTTTTVEPSTTTIEPTTTTPDDGQCGAPPAGIEDDFCWSLGNGFYVYPYDCNAYLSCRNGCTNLAYCIPDKLFNPLLHICDTPNSVQCTPKPFPTTTIATTQGSTVETSTTLIPSTTVATTTTTIATTAAPTTLPPGVNENACRKYPDNTRLPYAGNCSQYLLCQNQEVILGQCANGLLFNPDLGICDEAKDVYCYGDRTTSSTSTTSTTAAPTTVTIPTTTTPGAAELCADQEVGASFPYVEDCSKYILCLGGGEYYIAPCAGGYYDPKSQACGPNVSPTACKEKDTTTTTTTTVATTTTTEAVTPPATTTTVRPEEPAGICGGKEDGEMIAYPRDCSKYIVCVSPIPVAFYCLEGFYFNAKRQQCVSWQESDCDQEISTTPGYTSAPLEPTICTNSSRDTFPYPENCQWYIRCVNDYIYMMDVCNCGEYYDPIEGVCGADVPRDACRWDYTSTTTAEPTTESTTAITRPPPQKGPCDDATNGELVPYPNDCSKYIKCDRPIASAFDCEEGEEFSPELRKCMDASLANCNPGPTGPSTGTTPILTTANSDTSTTQEMSTTETTLSTTESTPSITTESTPSTTVDISTTESTPSTTVEISTTESTPSTTVEISTTQAISTTETSTTEITPTTAPPSGICGGKDEGTLVPYPNNCGKYIICKEPIPIGYDCPEGLEFSPTELECMDPDKANCNGGPTPGSTTPIPPYSTETTAESTTAEPSTTTPIITDSTTTDSTSTTATPLTTVTESTTTITDSTSTITDSTSTITDSTSTITDSTSTITDSTSTITDSTSTITDSTSTITDSTSTITDSTSTITDSTTVSTTEEPCTSTPTITDSTTTESTTTTTAIHPDTPNICCGVPLGTILPYPNDCNRYVVCDYPIPYYVVCPEGTAFDPLDLMCTAEGIDSCI